MYLGLWTHSNYPDRLDPALIRPGWVDLKLELGHAVPAQAWWLFPWFYQDCGLSSCAVESLADRFGAQVPRGKIYMAAIQEHLLRYRGALEAAAHEVNFDDQLTGPRKTEDHSSAMVVQAT